MKILNSTIILAIFLHTALLAETPKDKQRERNDTTSSTSFWKRPEVIFLGLGVTSFITNLIFSSSADDAAEQANKATSTADFMNARVDAERNTSLANYSRMAMFTATSAAVYLYATTEKKESSELEKQNVKLEKENSLLKSEKNILVDDTTSKGKRLRSVEKPVENNLQLTILPTASLNEGINITLTSKSDLERLTGNFDVRVAKPAGYNVKNDEWEKVDYSSSISWDKLGKNKDFSVATLYKMRNYQVLYVDLTEGHIPKQIILDTLKSRIKSVKDLGKEEISDCFLWISNGTDKKWGTMQNQEEVLRLLSTIKSGQALQFYSELQKLVNEVNKATEKSKNRIPVTYNFFISRTLYDQLRSDPLRLSQIVQQYKISPTNVIFYIKDDYIGKNQLMIGECKLVNWSTENE